MILFLKFSSLFEFIFTCFILFFFIHICNSLEFFLNVGFFSLECFKFIRNFLVLIFKCLAFVSKVIRLKSFCRKFLDFVVCVFNLLTDFYMKCIICEFFCKTISHRQSVFLIKWTVHVFSVFNHALNIEHH